MSRLVVRLVVRLVALISVRLNALQASAARLTSFWRTRLSAPIRVWRRRLLTRGAAILALLTLLAGPGSPLVSVLRPDGKTLTFSYDDAGRQTGLSDPDRGTESYAYDANGNVTQTTDARGTSGGGTIYAGYDGLNRQLWRNTSRAPTSPMATTRRAARAASDA